MFDSIRRWLQNGPNLTLSQDTPTPSQEGGSSPMLTTNLSRTPTLSHPLSGLSNPLASEHEPCHGCANSVASAPWPGVPSGEYWCGGCSRNPDNKKYILGAPSFKDNYAALDRLRAMGVYDQDATTVVTKLREKLAEYQRSGSCAECTKTIDYLCTDCRETMNA